MKRKAAKIHTCNVCSRKIQKGELYDCEKEYIKGTEGELFTYYFRECAKCLEETPKRVFKDAIHSIRAAQRKACCPDADFQYVWQGGWDTALGCADGGDVRLECNKCNLHCVKGDQ